jgi:arylsulfatase A-like enzyme
MSTSRRDFLKLAGLLSLGLSLRAPFHFLQGDPRQNAGEGPNFLVVVFDAFSGQNLSLYGYPRNTTPNIDRLAERATVYHRHVSSGNYTVPGTASLLSGQIPWSHRAFQFKAVPDLPNFPEQNIFKLFPGHDRLAYTHNPLADLILEQYFADINSRLPYNHLYLNQDLLPSTVFRNDQDTATLSWLRTMKAAAGEHYSLFLSPLYKSLIRAEFESLEQDFPRGLPNLFEDNFYLLEHAIDYVLETLPQSQAPFFGYFHLYPPHAPYNTRRDFFDAFLDDGFRPVEKPPHALDGENKEKYLLKERRAYDEFILYADEQFGRLFESLEASGMLENTWLVLTSDHGEMFERGVRGHGTPLLFQPVIHVPLLIFGPGQTTRQDVYEYTSSVDLLPTLLHLAGHSDRIPAWVDGDVLPPYKPRSAGKPTDIFAVQSPIAVPRHTMWIASTTIIREPYKLIYYYGYPTIEERGELFELYNLAEDPEEMVDIYESEPEIAAELLAELKRRIEEADQPYTKPDHVSGRPGARARSKLF